jgi:hypothetical protein
MKDIDRSKFTETILNVDRQVGAGEAELMDSDEDLESDQCYSSFKSILDVWGLVCVKQAAWA